MFEFAFWFRPKCEIMYEDFLRGPGAKPSSASGPERRESWKFEMGFGFRRMKSGERGPAPEFFL